MKPDNLPHGPEFRFLDEILALDPGKSGRAIFRLKGDEHFLRGHFPGAPIMPGVLMIEAVAQMAGVAAQSDPVIPGLPNLRLTAVRNAKILGTLAPGEAMEIEACVTGRLGNLIQAEGTVRTADAARVELLRAQVTLAGG
jgi:3-hydroxyacyl-[acyl-carrier-protein] dehydratase